MEEIILNVPSDTKRLDAYIAENTELSRSRATKLIEEGLVTVSPQARKQVLKQGMRYGLPSPKPSRLILKARISPSI